ncbi:carboxymuconolactone decarboxylase family protein [Variovorax sp. J22R133]|uniref:carboxymuconolactone decarboxylase family protein n=1 Tax=Variovorax brevis TaxID=3053503 RepID=UPI0025753D81|nr:carboxymuconolactone decarboxylase family protein [Variovorax sp. J22R133]MDM0114788.1 carboxymuconolactone decarboxylase family protein [Variovorax sp. J22R133]
MQATASPTPICDAMRAGGQWNNNWEPMAQLDADWTEKFMAMVSAPLNSGVIDPKTFELIAIAVDASVTHMFGPGVRRHIRRALALGVTPEEITAVLQLTSTLGLHTMSLGAPILFEEMDNYRRGAFKDVSEG